MRHYHGLSGVFSREGHNLHLAYLHNPNNPASSDLDNITISYGHNLSPIDPYSTLFTGPNLHPYEHYPEQKHGPQAQLRRPKRAVDLYAEQFGRDDEAMYRQQWPMSREISLNDLMRGRSVDLEELYPSVAVAEESFDLPMYLFRVGSFLP